MELQITKIPNSSILTNKTISNNIIKTIPNKSGLKTKK